MHKRIPLIVTLLGLAFVYIAERALTDTPRIIVVGVGLIGLIGGLVTAGLRMAQARGEVRVAYTRLFVHYVLAAFAVALYFAQTKELGLIPAGKPTTIANVVWPALLFLALAPAIAMERAVASTEAAGVVELFRVSAAARAARIVVLAMIAFAGINFAANVYNRKVDLSYFKTTMPSESTLDIVKTAQTPIEILLFYPVGNDVLEQVKPYFDDVARTKDTVTVRVVDQALDLELAKELKVNNNGFIYIRANGHDEYIKTDLELDSARTALRSLDADVQTKLLKALRPVRVAYFTQGHGERDFTQPTPDGRAPLAEFKLLLETQGFKIGRLGVADGLTNEVPHDAALVIIADPTQPFMATERDALQNYLAHGGRMLLMMEPDGTHSLTALTDRMGIKFGWAPLAQKRNAVRLADRGESPYYWATTAIQSHATVSTLQKASGRAVVVIVGQKVERAPRAPQDLTLTATVRSAPDAWEDINRNGQLDEPAETKGTFDLMYAIEGKFTIADATADTPKTQAQPGDLARVVVLGDTDTAANGIISGSEGNALLFIDTVHWLGGDDLVSGAPASEKDVPIMHRKEKDVVWFYGTSFIVPAAVLGLGLTVSKRARRTKREVKE